VLQAADGDDIDARPERLLEDVLDGDEVEEIALSRQLDQRVDVGGGLRLAARKRAEHADARDMPRGEFGRQPTESVEGLGEAALSAIPSGAALKVLRVGSKTAKAAKLPRFNGPKPKYAVNPAHAPGTLRRGKTPLPADAEAAYRRAVPDHETKARHWYGRGDDGTIYRFSNSNDGTVHFSGADGVGDGIRNITDYARRRLNGE
jgi:hypothetical protein